MTARPPNTRSPWRSFLRSRADDRLGVGLVMAIALQAGLSGATLSLPFAVLPLVQEAAPLLPAASGCLVGAMLVRRMPELEGSARGVLIRYRALLAVLVLLATAAASSAGLLSAPDRYHGLILRNALLFGGLALIGARILGARMAWLPVMLLAVVTFLDGKNRFDGSVRGWALLLHPANDARSAIVTLAIAILGLLLYAFMDSRAPRGRGDF